MPFANEFMDKYVAPGFSAFIAATIPDMSTRQPGTREVAAKFHSE